MFGLGFGEIFIVACLVLIVLGPKKLPEAARSLARFISELKNSLDSSEIREIKEIKEEFESLSENKNHSNQTDERK